MLHHFQAEAAGTYEYKLRNPDPACTIKSIELLATEDCYIAEIKHNVIPFFAGKIRFVRGEVPWGHGDTISVTVVIDHPQRFGLFLTSTPS